LGELIILAQSCRPKLYKSGACSNSKAATENLFLLIGNSRPIAEGHLVHHQHYQTRAEAKQELFEYIEVFYNRERLHYLSPVDYEMQLKSA